MPIFDIYSKRRKRLRGEVPDVYQYDKFPQAFRVQIFHLWRDTGFYGAQLIVTILCREYGLLELNKAGWERNRFQNLERNYVKELKTFILEERDVETVLDAVELIFAHYLESFNDTDTLEELNARFKEHGLGYQLENGHIVRVDNQLIHREAVKPALYLLADPAYAGAEEEFLSAFTHYRKAENKEAVNDALKAFESTMKIICRKRGWKFKETDPAKKLIEVCLAHELVPAYWQNFFGGLRATLESGVPTPRNKETGHGQEVPRDVPEHLVSYVLHLTASAIVFLVKSEQALD